MKILRQIFFFALSFFSWQHISSQNVSTYSFNELYSFEENTVFSMIQDKEGYVWLGTSNGLYRFNGYDFKHFTFPGFAIEYYNLKYDDFGRIWFANFGGQLFYLENDSLNLVVQNTLDNNYIYEYLVYDKNKIYYHTLNANNIVEVKLSGQQEKVILLNDKQKITSSVVLKDRLKVFVEEDFENERLIKVFDFNGKSLQINLVDSCILPIKSSKKFARQVNENSFVYIQHHNELDIVLFSKNNQAKVYQSDKLNSKTINNYKVINEQLVLLGIKKSFYLKFTANNKIEAKAFTNIKNASNLLQDNENNLWISSLNNGIFIAPNTVFQNRVISPFEAIKQVKVSENNEVFYVTDEGKLYELDWTSKTSNLIYNKNLNPNFKIDINPFKNELLIPGNKLFYSIDEKKWFYKNESNFFKDIHFLDKDIALFTLNSTDLIVFNNERNKSQIYYQFDTLAFSEHNDYKLYKIADGRAKLIAEESNKKHLYVNQINGVIHYSKEKAASLSYQGKPIIASTFKTGKSALWLADIEGNIHQIKAGKIVYTYPLGSRVSHIAMADSLVFLKTQKAIYRFNYEQKTLSKIDQTDGLLNENIVNLSTTDSSLIIWGTHTLQEIPFSYQYTNTAVPDIRISKMLVNGKLVDFSKPQTYKHHQNNFEFYFQSNAIRSQKQRTYYYKIKELSKDWKKTNFEVPYVRYSQLAPGAYTFQLKVENEDEVFSKTINVAFKIDKHFTKKWWFIFLITALLAALIFWVYTLRIKTLKKQARLKQEKESLQKDVYKAKISAIRAQMNPHFIFNALNSIQTLVLRGDIDNTYTYINKFAGLIRKTLNFSEIEYVSIAEEISLLDTYLNLEKLRFREDFDYEIIQKNLPNISLPPMLIQPFVENALKHGLLHLPTNRKIKLTFYFDEVLVCEVEDNGIGRKASEEINKRRNKEHKSFAISALKQRFEILQEKLDYQIGFTYFDLEENGVPKGTKVVIKIPFIYNS